ncbi:MAG: hypothetical protein WDN30_14400 [Pararobbsia sp.]
MIKPEVGRIVWYRAADHEHSLRTPDNAPLAAQIAYVHSDTCVNLSVLDANGTPHPRTSVMLKQSDDQATYDHSYAEWMPYQKGQAAKQDQAIS